MADKKVETVTLLAPNGQTVSVAESKADERVAAGYRRMGERASAKPVKRAPAKRSAASK